jgi:NAD(P)-dependent dehydrogenase (short-subunit alcohol dehydrogenase family)
MSSTKVAWISGAGSGIGKASVERFQAEGYSVTACDLNFPDDAFRGLARVQTVRLDVTDEKAVAASLRQTVEQFGGLDVVFANAGVSGSIGHFTELESDEFEFVFKVNILGVFYAFKHGAKEMLDLKRPQAGGVLLSTASVAGIRSGAGNTPYSASKAAVMNLTQTVCNQLTGTGIRVNAIAPGIIETGMTRPVFDLADAKNIRGRIGQLNALERYGHASEVASVAYFLASQDASYINGQTIAVDGGLSSSHPVAFKRKGKVSL